MGVNANILDKSGAWYAYNGEKIGQGRDNAREFLRENVELAREIENKVRESLGIPLLPRPWAVRTTDRRAFPSQCRSRAAAAHHVMDGAVRSLSSRARPAPLGTREHSRAELERSCNPSSSHQASCRVLDSCSTGASSTSAGAGIGAAPTRPASTGPRASARS